MELYLYSPSGPSWAVLRRTLPLPLPLLRNIKLLQLSGDSTVLPDDSTVLPDDSTVLPDDSTVLPKQVISYEFILKYALSC